jgi:LuxR family maltose regulon positive regulatory protein
VSLQQGDNDIENFLQHLITAFKDIDPHLVSQLSSHKRGEGQPPVAVARNAPYLPLPSNPEDRLIDFINALDQLPNEIAVILDEYHLIESPDIHQAVSFLINYLPMNVHLYIATRIEPPFQIAHLRARREMIDLYPDELLPDLA